MSSTSSIRPIVTPSPKTEKRPFSFAQWSISTANSRSEPTASGVVAGHRVVVESHDEDHIPTNGIAGPKTTGGEDEDGDVAFDWTPKQLGPPSLGASVITIDNGPSPVQHATTLGRELIEILDLKEGDKYRTKYVAQWTFVKSMSNNIDGAYACVNIQTGPAKAFMNDASRKNDRQKFPQLFKTISSYNNHLGTLCKASKLNAMPTSLSETGYHNDFDDDEKNRDIHLMNVGKKLAFKLNGDQHEISRTCSTNNQHHIISGKSHTYCKKEIAQHKGSNIGSGIVLSVVVDPKPGVDSLAVPHALMGAIKTITTSTKPQSESMDAVARELHKAIGRRIVLLPERNYTFLNPRPDDFDENAVRRTPTFVKWEKLKKGDTLEKARSEYIKGRGNDEERLMRHLFSSNKSSKSKICTIPRCPRLQQGGCNRMCMTHHTENGGTVPKRKRNKRECVIEGCTTPAQAGREFGGMCGRHHTQNQRK